MTTQPTNPDVFSLGKARQRGVAMTLVLITLAIVFVMGMAMLEGLPSDARATSNLADHTAAVYLAESGLAEGEYRFRHPPDGGEWTGVVGRSIDDSGNTYDITVTDLGDGEYQLTSTAHLTGRRGQSVEHAVSMVLSVDSAASGYGLSKAMVTGSGGFVPGNATVTGDIHVNGSASIFGEVTGEVAATGWVWNRGDIGSEAEYVDAYDVPEIDLDAYETYESGGAAGTAMVIDEDDVEELPGTLNPSDSANPLGVVVIDGDLDLESDLQVNNGILVVRGDVKLNGHRLQLDGQQGRFALLIEGRTWITGSSELIVNQGATYMADRMISWFRSRQSHVQFNDGLVTEKTLPWLFWGDLEIDNRAYRNQGIDTVSYFGGDDAGGDRVVTPLSYTVVNP